MSTVNLPVAALIGDRQNNRMDLKSILDRIEKRLEVTGQSAHAASIAAGKPDAIRNLRRAAVADAIPRNGISTSTLNALAPILGVSPTWLLEGGDEDNLLRVPIVGFVGAGAETHLFEAGQGPFDYVEAPPGSTDKTVGVEIRGESLGLIFDRWLVFYDDVRDPPSADLVGKLCVVGLPDGRVLIKKLMRGRDEGLFDLQSHEPPMYDQAVIWAARVKTMAPR